MIDICVPPLGESVLEATVGRWFVEKGAFVSKDTLLVEIETDKVTLEINAMMDGCLVDIFIPSGRVVSPNTVLGQFDDQTLESNVSKETTISNVGVKESVSVVVDESMPKKESTSPAEPAVPELVISEVKTSGLDSHDPQPLDMHVSQGVQRHPMSRVRKRIAERLKEAQNTAAILTTFNEVDLFALSQLRQKYQTAFTQRYGVKLGWMSLFAQATTRALQQFPNLNSRIDGDMIVTPDSVNMGIAVSTPYGLVVPVIKEVEKRSLGDLEQHIAAIANKAREKQLMPSDLANGTFTITNGGTFGSLLSTPILNPPQSGILGMHTIQDRPMVIQGQIMIRPMMYVALSYDHRLVDGQEAVSFLVSIKNILENPGVFWLGL